MIQRQIEAIQTFCRFKNGVQSDENVIETRKNHMELLRSRIGRQVSWHPVAVDSVAVSQVTIEHKSPKTTEIPLKNRKVSCVQQFFAFVNSLMSGEPLF